MIKSNSSVSVGGSGVQIYDSHGGIYLKAQIFPKFAKSHLFPTETSASSSGRGWGVMYEDTPIYSLEV